MFISSPIVASRIYALFVVKSTSVPKLGGGGGGGVKPILAMPRFWERLLLQHLTYLFLGNRKKTKLIPGRTLTSSSTFGLYCDDWSTLITCTFPLYFSSWKRKEKLCKKLNIFFTKTFDLCKLPKQELCPCCLIVPRELAGSTLNFLFERWFLDGRTCFFLVIWKRIFCRLNLFFFRWILVGWTWFSGNSA